MSDMTSSVHNKKPKNQLNVLEEMYFLAQDLQTLKNINRYDVDMLLNSWKFQLSQLNFFYKNLVDRTDTKSANDAYYNLNREPKEHQLIYVRLDRGYPKELFDGHWCYYLKNCKTKYLVIPTTSLKEDSSMAESEFHLDIQEESEEICRLRLDEIRMVDKMRVDERKGYINIITDYAIIESAIESFMKYHEISVDKTVDA